MNKSRSCLLLGILCILFITAIAIFFSLMQQFHTDIPAIVTFNVVLFLLFLSIVITLIHLIMLDRGLSIEHVEKGVIDSPGQVAVFLPVSSREISKMDYRYNIVDLACNSILNQQDCVLTMKQNRGILPYRDLSIQLDSTQGFKLLYDIRNVDGIPSSGIYIVAKGNVQHLKSITEGCTDLKILCPVLKGKHLSLACKYVEFCDGISKYCLTKGNFQEIVNKKVISSNGFEDTIYDVVAYKLLSLCPMTDLVNVENFQSTSEHYKMLLAFFSIFGSRGALGQGGLCERIHDPELEYKALCVETYILTSVTPQYDPESERKVFTMIQDTYFKCSCEVNDYNSLYENRYVGRCGEHISDLMRGRIRNERLYKYICAIASYSSIDSGMNNPTDMFIDELLHVENCAYAYDIVFSILTDDPKTVIPRLYYVNQELNDVLNLLLEGVGFYSNAILISAAREYIMQECRPHMKLYCEREYLLDVGIVDRIVVSPSVGQNISVIHNIQVHDEHVQNACVS
ncbi:hypothetical protein EDL81_01975 [Ehrlichia ruminantium]|uniref:hypothetical protein n=1 Tax=Ehrlichia ruminantium TaxID=779 RepID=UPI00130D82B9|nr:hypothetical protein [Ehrlichia ruminantium]QGR02434.1 hypothetical protein EDL81_01975 [Ehrlichia ruminantium]